MLTLARVLLNRGTHFCIRQFPFIGQLPIFRIVSLVNTLTNTKTHRLLPCFRWAHGTLTPHRPDPIRTWPLQVDTRYKASRRQGSPSTPIPPRRKSTKMEVLYCSEQSHALRTSAPQPIVPTGTVPVGSGRCGITVPREIRVQMCVCV